MRMAAIATFALSAPLSLGACLPPPYEAEPTSSYQWQRRQEDIQRRETERLNRCANARPMSRAWFAANCNEHRENDKDLCSGMSAAPGTVVLERYSDGTCRVRENDLG